MTLTITGTTSDHTPHPARQAPGRNDREVSWLPGQAPDSNTADVASGNGLHEGRRLWPRIQGWAAELGLTAPQAAAAACQPPSGGIDHDDERAGGPLDWGAAD